MPRKRCLGMFGAAESVAAEPAGIRARWKGPGRRRSLLVLGLMGVLWTILGNGFEVTTLAAQPSEPAPRALARAADGVQVDAEGNPFYATFSLCAIDPKTGESAVIVTTRVPFVGRAVPWARAGVGAVATQAWTVVEYGERGLDLMAAGKSPQEALDTLLADDEGRERRQLGLIDMQGRTAAHSGSENGDWAGSQQGENYTVQGNILVSPEVISAVAHHFESTAGSSMPLAERMILAMEQGQKLGGDKRWGYFQSAAIRVADPGDPGRGGDHLSLSIDVGEHEHPVEELKRIYYRTQQRLGYREFSQVRGPDVVELKRMLHALGYWRKDLKAFPDPPEFEGDPSKARSEPDAFSKQVEEYRAQAGEYENIYGVFDQETVQAVDHFRRENHLDFIGNPPGLVDQRLVSTLRERYEKTRR